MDTQNIQSSIAKGHTCTFIVYILKSKYTCDVLRRSRKSKMLGQLTYFVKFINLT